MLCEKSPELRLYYSEVRCVRQFVVFKNNNYCLYFPEWPLVCIYPLVRRPYASPTVRTPKSNVASSLESQCLSVISSGPTSVCDVCIASSELVNARAINAVEWFFAARLVSFPSLAHRHVSRVRSSSVFLFLPLRVLREDNVVPFKRATTLIYGEIEHTPCYASTGAANPRADTG